MITSKQKQHRARERQLQQAEDYFLQHLDEQIKEDFKGKKFVQSKAATFRAQMLEAYRRGRGDRI